MCTGLEIAAIGAVVGGGVLSADQQNRSGKQSQREFEAKGAFARLQASKKAARMHRSNAKFIAKQRTAFAKSGVALGSGSPLDVVAETAAELELNALNVFLTGTNAEAQAVARGRQARRATRAGAIGTIFSTVASVATIGAASGAGGDS